MTPASFTTRDPRPRFGTRLPRPLAPVLAGLVAAVLATLAGAWLTEPAPVPGVVLPPSVVDYGVPLARTLLDLALTSVLGLGLLPLLFGPSPDREPRRVLAAAHRGALVAAVVWLVAALLSVVLQTAELAPVPGVTAATLTTYVRDFGSAQALLASAAVAALAAAVAAFGIRGPGQTSARLLVLTVGLGLLPLLATGHSGELTARWHDLTMVSLELHVYAATAWAGGLAAIAALLLAHPRLLSRALPRFSQLAGLCLAVVAVSGVLNALVELATTPGVRLPSALLTSPYGQLVVAKAGCLAMLAPLGGYIRFRLLPAIARGERTSLAWWLGGELAVLGVAFGVAVVLSRSGVAPPGR